MTILTNVPFLLFLTEAPGAAAMKFNIHKRPYQVQCSPISNQTFSPDEQPSGLNPTPSSLASASSPPGGAQMRYELVCPNRLKKDWISLEYVDSRCFSLQTPGLASSHEGICAALLYSLWVRGRQRSYREGVEGGSAGSAEGRLCLHHRLDPWAIARVSLVVDLCLTGLFILFISASKCTWH